MTTASQDPASLLTVILDGVPEITGLVLSTTVTVCVAVFVFPDPSVTVQVTVVLPNEYVAGASLVTDATEQLSAVMALPNETPVA